MKAAFEEAFQRRLETEVGLAATLADVRGKLRRGDFYDPVVVDFVFQDYRSYVSFEAAYVFAHVWGLIHTGRLWTCTIPVGACPAPDAAEDVNRSRLSGLPKGFSVDLYFGKYLQDGNLHWDFDLGLFTWVDSEDGCGCDCGCGLPAKVQIHKFFKPGVASLEIGTTASHKTWEHLLTQQSLARWSYDRECIVLGIVDPPLFLLPDVFPEG